MIQVNEIRLGNYYKDRHGKVFRVDFIEYIAKGYAAKIGQNDGQESNAVTEYSDYAEAIKITPEWLIQFRFEKTDDYGDHIYYEPKDRGAKNYYVCFYGDITAFGLSQFPINVNLIYNENYLQYVHQLQNLYYALTGVELTVKEK